MTPGVYNVSFGVAGNSTVIDEALEQKLVQDTKTITNNWYAAVQKAQSTFASTGVYDGTEVNYWKAKAASVSQQRENNRKALDFSAYLKSSGQSFLLVNGKIKEFSSYANPMQVVITKTASFKISVDKAKSDASWNCEIKAISLLNFTRHAGVAREHTAVLASKKAYPATANAVVIANSGNFPDALSAAPLAGVINGPILLTPTASLHDQVRVELLRLVPKTVYIVGDTNSVSNATRNQIKSALPSVVIVPLGGKDRYETSRLIADKVVELGGSTQQAFLVNGNNFPDALAGGASLGNRGGLLLITSPTTLSDSAKTPISTLKNKIVSIEILGGTPSVSAGVEAQVGKLMI